MASVDPFLVRAVDLVRRFSQDTLDGVRWPPEKIVELTDASNNVVHNLLVSNTEPKSHRNFTETTVTLTAGVRDYPWPGNFRRFLRLVQKNTNGDITNEILPADYLADTMGIILFDKMRGYRINPAPATTETWTLVYEPSALQYLGFGRVDTGTHTTTSMVLKVPDSTYVTDYSTGELGALGLQDDFYNSSYVRVIDKTDNSWAIRRVADWVGSTRTLTLDSALPFTPVAGDIYEFLPCLTYPLDSAILWKTVMTMKAADADVRHRATAEKEFQSLMAEALVEAGDIQSRVGPVCGSAYLDTFDYGGRGDRGDYGYFGIGVGLTL